MSQLEINDLEDTDEILNPITVTESITIDQVLQDSPNFVALDDDSIAAFAGDLLNDENKGEMILDLHKQTVGHHDLRDLRDLSHMNIKFNVSARLVVNDAVSEKEYKDQWKQLYDTAPHHTYVSEKSRLSLPYEKTTTTTQDGLTLDPSVYENSTKIVLDNGDGDEGVLLPEDDISPVIVGVQWCPPSYTKESYIFDESTVTECKHCDAGDAGDTLDNVLRRCKPSLDDVHFTPNGVVMDTHEIRASLANIGISFDKLKGEEITAIVDKINAAANSIDETKDPEFAWKVVKGAATKMAKQKQASFVDAVSAYLDRVGAYMTDTRKLALQAAFDAFLSSHPQYSLADGVDNPFQMAMSLIHSAENADAFNEAVQRLKDVANRINTSLVRDFLVALQEFEDASAKSTAEFLSKVLDSRENKDYVALVETSTFKDIHEIVKGLDTSMYEGIDTNRGAFMSDPDASDNIAIDDYDESIMEDNDAVPNSILYMTIPEPLQDVLVLMPANHRDNEILQYAFMSLHEIADVSGLPWPYELWLSEAFREHAFPQSRYETLKAKFPEVAGIVLNSIARTSTEKDGLSEIAKMSNRQLANEVEKEYPAIIKKWQDEIRYAIIDGVSFWAIEVLERSLSGTLEFQLPNNEFAHYWSAYGAPTEKGSNRGVFVYLAKISNVDIKVLLEHAETHYKYRYDRVVNMKPATGKGDSAAKAQEAFTTALAVHKANKQKIEFFLRTYVPMYLHLPSTMVQKVPLKKQPPWAQGCCIVPLGSTYEADLDFKYNDSKQRKESYLYTIKSKLSDKRWLKATRPSMFVIAPPENSNKMKEEAIPIIPIAAVDYATATANDNEPSHQAANSNANARELLADIAPNSHITDYEQGRYSAFRTSIVTVYNRALEGLPENTIAAFRSIIESSLDITCYIDMIISMCYFIYKRGKDSPGLESLTEIKSRLTGLVPIDIARYLLAVCITYIPQGNIVEVIDMLNDIATNATTFTEEEAREFINKKREETKTDILRKTDAMSREDREVAKYANKLGIAKYATMADPTASTAQQQQEQASSSHDPDAQGESEYVQRSVDADDDDGY